MQGKIIVISQRHELKIFPDGNISHISMLEDSYVEYWGNRFGACVIPISNAIQDISEWLDLIKPDGIIISGGMGIHAKFWREEQKYDNNFSDDRVRIDKELIDYAIKKDVPLLGICTGAHYLNVYFGGSLIQNIKEEEEGSVAHVSNNHEILFWGDIAKDLLGNKGIVNSYHNQAIKRDMVAKDLKIFASCKEDGTIEALYHPKYALVAITWHPERALAKGVDSSAYDAMNEKLAKAFLDRTHFFKKIS